MTPAIGESHFLSFQCVIQCVLEKVRFFALSPFTYILLLLCSLWSDASDINNRGTAGYGWHLAVPLLNLVVIN